VNKIIDRCARHLIKPAERRAEPARRSTRTAPSRAGSFPIFWLWLGPQYRRAGNELSRLNGPSGLGCAAIAGRPTRLPCNHAAKSSGQRTPIVAGCASST